MSIVSHLAWGRFNCPGFPISPPTYPKAAPSVPKPGDGEYSIFKVDSTLSRTDRARRKTPRALLYDIQMRRSSHSELSHPSVMEGEMYKVDLLCHEKIDELLPERDVKTRRSKPRHDLPADLDDLDKTVSDLTEEELLHFHTSPFSFSRS